MFWQDDDSEKPFEVPDDILDVLFSIDCKRLPVDHAYDLSAALRNVLPWVADDPLIGVHAVHVAGSQNGWERPEHGTSQHLIVSRRTKLTIRVPTGRLEALKEGLTGKTLEVSGCAVRIGAAKVRPLSRETTLFSRYLVSLPGEGENRFLSRAADELGAMGIRLRKALCGKEIPLATPDGPIHTRGLMLASLSPEESVRLQEAGLGPRRWMGCGIFLPHKGIEGVRKGG